MTIRFWNPQYARGFAEANHLELGVLPVTKYYSGGSLLKGATKPRVIGWVLCVMLAATSGLHAWMGGGANHRSSAEQAVTNGHGGDNFGSAYDAQRTERQARIDRLTEEHEVLVAKLKELDSQLEAEKSGLELVSTALERRGQAIENARSYLDNTDPNAVSSFNTEVDAYNGQRRAFTERVAQYNRKVRDGRADLDRLRQIESALGEMGVPYE
jgi:cell division protein FtsB